jgi:hypothetical protein
MRYRFSEGALAQKSTPDEVLQTINYFLYYETQTGFKIDQVHMFGNPKIKTDDEPAVHFTESMEPQINIKFEEKNQATHSLGNDGLAGNRALGLLATIPMSLHHWIQLFGVAVPNGFVGLRNRLNEVYKQGLASLIDIRPPSLETLVSTRYSPMRGPKAWNPRFLMTQTKGFETYGRWEPRNAKMDDIFHACFQASMDNYHRYAALLVEIAHASLLLQIRDWRLMGRIRESVMKRGWTWSENLVQAAASAETAAMAEITSEDTAMASAGIVVDQRSPNNTRMVVGTAPAAEDVTVVILDSNCSVSEPKKPKMDEAVRIFQKPTPDWSKPASEPTSSEGQVASALSYNTHVGDSDVLRIGPVRVKQEPVEMEQSANEADDEGDERLPMSQDIPSSQKYLDKFY